MNYEKLTWYVARSGGIVAWSLLALSLILGLVLSSRLLGRRASPAWILSIHRFLGGLGVIFTAVHIAAIMLDDFVDFGFTEVLVPWASTWRPGPTAWGIIAMYLMIAIELTSFAMRRLPKFLWRGVHWLSAPLFIMASVHGYQSGADAGQAFILTISGVVVVLTILTVVRVRRAKRAEARVDPRTLVSEAKARKTKRKAAAPAPSETTPGPPPLFDAREPALVGGAPVREERGAPEQLAEALPAVPPSLPVFEPRGPLEEPSPRQPPPHERTPRQPPPHERTPRRPPPDERTPPPPPVPQPISAEELVSAASTLEPDAVPAAGVPPAPAWRPAPDAEPDGPLAWVNADAEGNPNIRRRPGPVSGVWKRSERDLDKYR